MNKPGSHVKLLDRLDHVNSRLFDIIFNAVQEGALIYDEGGQILEELC
jgi:hypothetical protein